ncbi:UNVERIFIED_CONTAM: hypothetical protein HDU68_006603 [Siphonaria sp. JEL0065]|nr:hypothetical protein HDU68_006603 [Siphonaria sp. JEL0065]
MIDSGATTVMTGDLDLFVPGSMEYITNEYVYLANDNRRLLIILSPIQEANHLDADLAKYLVPVPGNPQSLFQMWTIICQEINHNTATAFDTLVSKLDCMSQHSELTLAYALRVGKDIHTLSLDGYPTAANRDVVSARWGSKFLLGLQPDNLNYCRDAFACNLIAGVVVPITTIDGMTDFLQAEAAFVRQAAAHCGDDHVTAGATLQGLSNKDPQCGCDCAT